MKIFSGFPEGKVKVTPLPNLFFSELLPEIEDLAELKVTLHVLWTLANSKSRFVRESDLRADKVLVKSLKEIDAQGDAMAHGLDLAVKRGTLLGLKIDQDVVYFANSRQGRDALDKMRTNELELEPPQEPAQISERSNIFVLYEQNIGLLTPMLTEELRDAEKQYPAEWISEAFKIAVKNNVRKWSYIHKILTSWETDGKTQGKRKRWWDDEYDQYINR